MKYVALALAVGAAGCDFGIGSDPNPGRVEPICAPGHTRDPDTGACVSALVPSIAIDGATGDWASVPSIPITGGTLAFAGNNRDSNHPGDISDLLLRATFAGGPLDTVEINLAPSPVRPASGGTDRMTVDATGIHYEKNGIAVTPSDQELTLQWTPDGFEADVDGFWLAYQGALRLQLVGTRGGAEVLRGEAIDICFGFRTGSYALPKTACEVTP
jgi:hypothetical protein